jgi:hypothetical protein
VGPRAIALPHGPVCKLEPAQGDVLSREVRCLWERSTSQSCLSLKKCRRFGGGIKARDSSSPDLEVSRRAARGPIREQPQVLQRILGLWSRCLLQSHLWHRLVRTTSAVWDNVARMGTPNGLAFIRSVAKSPFLPCRSFSVASLGRSHGWPTIWLTCLRPKMRTVTSCGKSKIALLLTPKLYI